MSYPVAARGKNYTAGAAVVIPWYLTGGIAAANCIAAYQPKGAADIAASYVNLANPGTYNAAPGTAPTFDTATGWTFNGSTQYLTTGNSTLNKPVGFFARVTATNLLASRAIIGSGSGSNTTNGFEFRADQTTGTLHLLQENVASVATSTTPISAGTNSVVGVTYSATGEYVFYLNGTAVGSGTNDKTFTNRVIVIGASAYGAPTIHEVWLGIITAVALYNTVLNGTVAAALSAAMAAL